MKEVTVNIQTVNDVKKVVNACSKHHGDVFVYSGKYIVSGKSILGLYSLDLTPPIKLEFDGDISEEIRKELAPLVIA